MINLAINAGIRAATALTDKVEPYKELTRELPMKGTGLSYGQRAELFESDLVDRFLLPNGIYAYRIHEDPLVIGDQALWHGIATAMWAFKFKATHSTEDLRRLGLAVKAMELHFPGPKHWLIRGVDPLVAGETLRMADDASNDAATGPLAGAYFAWMYGQNEVLGASRQILEWLAQELLQNDYCLMRQDGTPTTYGRLVNGMLTDPLRVSLAMAIFLAAYNATIEREYLDAFDYLARKYRDLLRTPIFKFLWMTKSHEAHRAALHLTIIADHADRKTAAAALEGLEFIRHYERKAGNSWILALVSRHLALSPREREIYRGRQLEYEPSERGPDTERANSPEFWKRFGVDQVKWPPRKILGQEPRIRASQALPFWRMASQDFFPQRDLFSWDGWLGRTAPSGYHSGLDYLSGHWCGVNTGLVGKDE